MEIKGAAVRGLMRIHGVTIRGLASQYKVTLKRVREVRECGAVGFSGDEWFMLITGKWPDQASEKELVEVRRLNRREDGSEKRTVGGRMSARLGQS